MRTYLVNRVIDATVELTEGSLVAQEHLTAIATIDAPSRQDAERAAHEAFPGSRLDLSVVQPHNQAQQRLANELPRI